MPTTESSFEHNGLMLINVQETNDDGAIICSGCKEPLNPLKAYAYGRTEGENTRRFFSVHKYCNVKD